MHFENTLVMYGVYNAETLDRLVKPVHTLCSKQTLYESVFAGKTSAAYEFYSSMHGEQGIQHYAIKLMLYLRTTKDKYIEIYNKFISQLCIYTKAVRILAKGYFPISLITPLKFQEILNSIKEMLTKTNPDYDIVITRLYLYYNMKLATFRIDRNRNLIIQFPVFIQPYMQQSLTLCDTYENSGISREISSISVILRNQVNMTYFIFMGHSISRVHSWETAQVEYISRPPENLI